METYTRAELLSSRDSIWSICDTVTIAFEKCKMEKGQDPKACLAYSTAVMGCSQK
eukprot:gene11231-13759_t